MELTIRINLDNAAFHSDDESEEINGGEIARILRKLAESIDGELIPQEDAANDLDGVLFDFNGNRCGDFGITE